MSSSDSAYFAWCMRCIHNTCSLELRIQTHQTRNHGKKDTHVMPAVIESIPVSQAVKYEFRDHGMVAV